MSLKKIRIKLNGKEEFLPDGKILKEYLEERNLLKQYYAVAVNETFIPKSEYNNVVLKDQDEVEVLAPMQGG